MGLPMYRWYPGLKVKCIDATGIKNWERKYTGRLTHGAEYTLRDIRPSDKPHICPLAVELVEIAGFENKATGMEFAFYAKRFVAPEPKKTSFELFTGVKEENWEQEKAPKEKIKEPEKVS